MAFMAMSEIYQFMPIVLNFWQETYYANPFGLDTGPTYRALFSPFIFCTYMGVVPGYYGSSWNCLHNFPMAVPLYGKVDSYYVSNQINVRFYEWNPILSPTFLLFTTVSELPVYWGSTVHTKPSQRARAEGWLLRLCLCFQSSISILNKRALSLGKLRLPFPHSQRSSCGSEMPSGFAGAYLVLAEQLHFLFCNGGPLLLPRFFLLGATALLPRSLRAGLWAGTHNLFINVFDHLAHL